MINPVVNSTPSSAQNISGQQNSTAVPDGFGAVLSSQMGDRTTTGKTAGSENAPAPQTNGNTPTTPTTNDSKTATADSSDATRQLSALLRKNKALKEADDTKLNQDKTPPAADTTALTALLQSGIKTTPAASQLTKSSKDKTLPQVDATLLTANPNVSVASGIRTDINTDTALKTKPGEAINSSAAILTSASQQTQDKVDPTAHLADPKILTATQPVLTSKTETVKTVELAASLPSEQALTAAAQIAANMPSKMVSTQTSLTSNMEAVKTVELAANLPSEQALAQTAAAQIAANMPSKMVSTQTSIAAPLGSNAWPEEFSQKISWISTQQNQIAELHLNPPDLGPMSVVLSVANNQATALFTSPHAEVRQAIENAMPQLRERLADNGIMLGNATVSDQTPRDSGAGNFTNQRNTPRMEMTNLSPADASPLMTTVPRRHNGMLDTFA